MCDVAVIYQIRTKHNVIPIKAEVFETTVKLDQFCFDGLSWRRLDHGCIINTGYSVLHLTANRD